MNKAQKVGAAIAALGVVTPVMTWVESTPAQAQSNQVYPIYICSGIAYGIGNWQNPNDSRYYAQTWSDNAGCMSGGQVLVRMKYKDSAGNVNQTGNVFGSNLSAVAAAPSGATIIESCHGVLVAGGSTYTMSHLGADGSWGFGCSW